LGRQKRRGSAHRRIPFAFYPRLRSFLSPGSCSDERSNITDLADYRRKKEDAPGDTILEILKLVDRLTDSVEMLASRLEPEEPDGG
jgi:hypothetical protein